MIIDYFKPISSCISPTSSAENETCEKPPSSKPPKEAIDDYDPHSFGKQKHATLYWGSVFHLIKSIFGAGILALPFAFKSVGYGVAIVGTIFIGFMYIHVLHLLLDVEYRLCRKLKTPNLTYVGVVQNTFETGPRYVRGFTGVAKFLLYFHYTFNKTITNALYLIMISGNFKAMADHYFGTKMSLVSWINIVIVPLVGLACIRNLKFLAPLSIVTNICQMISLVIIIAVPYNYDGPADLQVITDINNFPDFFGVVLGAFSCTGIILPLKNDLKEPKIFTSFFGVLNSACSASVLLFCAFGGLAYAKYGDQLQPNVLLNLPQNHLVSFIISSLYSLAVSLSFILFIYVAFDTLWSNIFVHKNLKYPKITEYAIRILFCLLPYITAVSLPDFKIVFAIVGVLSVLMDELFPIVLHFVMLIVEKPKTVRMRLVLLKDAVLIVICFSVFFGNLVSVIRSIIRFYS